jgi:hypothetical protein
MKKSIPPGRESPFSYYNNFKCELAGISLVLGMRDSKIMTKLLGVKGKKFVFSN